MYCAIKRCRRSQNERHGPKRAKRPLPPEHDGPHHRGQGCGWHMISRPLRGRLQQTSEHVQQLRKRPLPPEHDGSHHQRLIRVDSFDLNLGGPKTPNELFCTNFRFLILTTVPHLPGRTFQKFTTSTVRLHSVTILLCISVPPFPWSELVFDEPS